MTGEKWVILLAGYMIGSIPFAYLLVRRAVGADLRELGSRNIGARNAYEVTGKGALGIVILLLDFAKGAVPILLAGREASGDLIPWLAFAIVLGHCYPVWLLFHGGRGLATEAGIMLVLSPLLIALWLVSYAVAGKLYQNVHVASFAAIVLSAVLVAVLPDGILDRIRLGFYGETVGQLRLCVLLTLGVIATRHIQPVIDHFSITKSEHAG